MKSKSRWLLRYGGALAAVGVGLLLRLGVTAWVGPGLPTYITFYPVIMAVALLAGLGPGLFATAATVAAVDYWVVTPHSLGSESRAEAVGMGLFAVMGLFMSVVAELYRRDRLKAAAYDQELALRESREEIRRQREWLKVTLTSIGDAVLAADTAGRITFLNPVAESLTGWREQEALGQPVQSVFRIINEATRVPPEDIVAQVLREGHIIALANHTALVTRDGREVPIEDSAAPIKDSAGVVTGVVLVFHDVTQKRRDQEALEKSRQRNAMLASFIENSSQAFGMGYPDGRLVRVNLAFERLTGYTAEELRKVDWAQALTPPDWRDFEQQKLEELRATGQPVRYEKEYRRKDGSRVPIELHVHLARDAEGKPQYYYSFLTDITERKRAEVAERRLNAELRQRVAELQAANQAVETSRRAALRLAEDAAEARKAAEAISAELRTANETLATSHVAALNLMDDAVHARQQAEQAAAELEAASENLRKLNRALKALGQSNQSLIRAASEAEFLQGACKIVVEACGYKLVWVGIAEPDQARTVRPVASAGFEEGYLDTLKISWADTERGRGPTGTAIRAGKPCSCRNMLTDPAFEPWRAAALKRGYASSLALPLFNQGKAFGAITIYSQQPDPFGDDEVSLLTDLANDIAYGIEVLRARAARVQAEEAMRDSESRLAGIVGSAMDAILSVDADQRIVVFNAAAERIFRCPAAEALGQPLDKFIPERLRTAHREHVREFGVTGVTARAMGQLGELTALRADGEVFPIEASISQGEVRGQRLFTVILRDITQRKQAEAQLQERMEELTAVRDELAGQNEALVRTQEALRQVNEELEERVVQRTTEVREREARYRSLVTATSQIVWITDPQGRVSVPMPAWQAFTGQTFDQYQGAGWAEAAHPDDRQRTTEVWSRAVAARTLYETEYRLRRHDGLYRDVVARGVPVLEPDGAVREWVGTCTDISERKEAERRREFTSQLLALFAQKATINAYLEAVIEIVSRWSGCQALGIRIMDDKQEVPYQAWSGFEPGFLELERCLSLEHDRCLCIRAISGAFEEPDRPILTPGGSFRCDDAIAFAAALPPEHQAHYRGACMKFGFASLAVIPVRYRDQVVGAIHLADRRPARFTPAAVEFIEAMTPLIGEAVHRFQTEAELAQHRDHLEVLVKQRTGELITANAQLELEIVQRRRAQESLEHTAKELERSNQDLEQFAYVASHDLQEPLRAVGGYVKLLERRVADKLDAKALEFITGAVDGAGRMERLITDLLAFSRVGTRGGSRAITNLDGVLDDALNNLQASLQAAHATLTREPMPNLPVDATQFVQLLQNLVGNALKFRSGRPPQIHVGARREPGRWVFSVQDNGIGIDPKYFERIFQIFQRLHTRKQYPGTGIGLAICKKIVERHGGTIWIESQPDAGATFFFSIPEPGDQTGPAGAAMPQPSK